MSESVDPVLLDEQDPRMGAPGSARYELWWALWDNYTPNVKAALIDNLIAEHSEAGATPTTTA